MIDNTMYPNTANWNIADGMTVYSTDGEKVGTVRNYDPQAGYLDVQKGWLFKKDFYVPQAQVDAVTPDGVTLKLTKDELENDRYSSPPVPTAAKLDPVKLADGSVMIETAEVREEPLDEADAAYGRSTADQQREDWANRPR